MHNCIIYHVCSIFDCNKIMLKGWIDIYKKFKNNVKEDDKSVIIKYISKNFYIIYFLVFDSSL